MQPIGTKGALRALLFAGAAGMVLLLMPSILAPYPLVILSQMLIFAIACLALNLAYGTAGMLSLGHATYFGVAAYTGAFLYRFTNVDSFELYLLAGVASATVFAAAIGYVCVRTTKMFFAILTLAVSMIVYSLVINGAAFRLFGGVGWAYTCSEVARCTFPVLPSWAGSSPPPTSFRFYTTLSWLPFWPLPWRFGESAARPSGKRCGQFATMIRAAFIGIPVGQYRWRAFIISGFFMGLAGGLYGQLARQITPDQLHWLFSAQLVLATVLGGSRHFLGPILGASPLSAWMKSLRNGPSGVEWALDYFSSSLFSRFQRVSPARSSVCGAE